MLNFQDGQPIATITSGKYKGEVIFLDHNAIEDGQVEGCHKIDMRSHKLSPLLNTDARQVCYISGPSGSGKSYYASNLAKTYQKIFPDRDVYLFSRTDYKNDPAYVPLKPLQVNIDEKLIEEPIDIARDIQAGSLMIFDDVGTIRDDKIKKEVFKLMEDIMEVGRKLEISLIITNHLVNPNERKFGRTVMNELQSFTFFPKSGSAHQVTYCLKNYFGMSKKQIEEIMALPSRWVTVLKNYPQCVMHERGAYLL